MTYYSLSALLNGITLSVIGVIVFLKDRKNLLNITYTIFCFSISFWSYSYFIWQISNTYKNAFFWCEMLMLGAIFIPITYFHFVTFLTKKINNKVIKKFVYFGYIIAVIFAILNFTPLMIVDVRKRMEFLFWPTAGIAYKYYLLYFAIYAIYGCFLLLQAAIETKGYKRNQFIYVFVGSVLGYIGGATNFPLWYDIPMPPIGNIFITVYGIIVTYAILKHRLMGIELAKRYLAIYICYILVGVVIFLPAILLVKLPTIYFTFVFIFSFRTLHSSISR